MTPGSPECKLIDMRIVVPICASLVLILSQACDKEKPATTTAPSASASASAAPVKPKEPPKRVGLNPRTRLDVAATKKARRKILGAMKTARGLADEGKHKEALSALEGVRDLDPTGGVLLVEMAQIAVAGEDNALASRLAKLVLAQPFSAPGATKAAEKVLDKLGQESGAAPPKDGDEPKPGPYKSLDEACEAIVAAVRAGKGPAKPDFLGEIEDVTCALEPALEFKEEGLKEASPLRVEVKAKRGTQLLAWVGVQKPKELLLHGPVENIVAPADYGLTNHFAIALERTNVLPGGASEIVVRLTERLAVADVALNEVAEVDRTRATILTTDRDGIVESEGFVLNEAQVRKAMDEEDKALPDGWKSSKLDKPEEFRMKVQWATPNGIILTQDEGKLKPPFEGNLTLFPEPSAEEEKK